MIQAFNAVFGVAVGRVVTLAFLMLQLVSAGGIYPVETTAKPFQVIHPFDPMTYAVNGLRQLTVGGIDSRLWIAIVVLAALTGRLVGRQCLGGPKKPAVHDGAIAPAHRSLTASTGRFGDSAPTWRRADRSRASSATSEVRWRWWPTVAA